MSKNLEIWEDIFKKREWGRYPPIPLVRIISKKFINVKNKDSIKILELGSGGGANLWFVAREGYLAYGIEGSETAKDKSIKYLQDENLKKNIGEIIAGDYENIPFPDNFFDAIIDIESLCCNPFDKTKKIIKNSFNKLKRGGMFFSMTFADGTWGTDAQEISYHAVYPDEGPMAGMGFTRYTTRDDINKLYKLSNNNIDNIELYERHLNNGKSIREWAIEIHKL